MTQEDKKLLLQDLCSRLPYGVKIELTWWVMGEGTCIHTTLEPDHIEQLLNDEDGDTEIKPYLRPLSSMSEEEEKVFKKIVYDSMNIDNISASAYVADWLYSKHLDVHGLIPKGLALEAPEGMYKK